MREADEKQKCIIKKNWESQRCIVTIVELWCDNKLLAYIKLIKTLGLTLRVDLDCKISWNNSWIVVKI